MRTENDIYFCERINSSKANQFTAQYHYSGVGFKKAVLNLGIFRKQDNLLVGVLQWGCSYQDSIRLDRYVKDEIKKDEYLELNRFCMADSEGKNSESQGISLGIKWIKKNTNVRLLVSYSGRKEGNYGYIYQATNWEYLGYFVSSGFWLVDGEERHQVTLWYRHINHGNPDLKFREDICNIYQDVRQTWTKQFIYVMRLDKRLTLSSPVLPYPKPSNEFPIMTREEIYKQNDEVFYSYAPQQKEKVYFYYEPEKYYFTKKTLQRRGELPETVKYVYAQYDVYGQLERTATTMKELVNDEIKLSGISDAIRLDKVYKNKFFKSYIDINDIPEEIDVPIIGIIDEIPFARIIDIANYLNVSRQAVSKAKVNKKPNVNGTPVIWAYD